MNNQVFDVASFRGFVARSAASYRSDALSRLRERLREELPTEASLVRLAFESIKILKKQRIELCPVHIHSSVLNLRYVSYRTLRSDRGLTLCKLILHIGQLAQGIVDHHLDFSNVHVGTNMNTLCIVLRRLLETLLGGKTFRYGPLKRSDGPQRPALPRGVEHLGTDSLGATIVDANNRFSVLFDMWSDEYADPTFAPREYEVVEVVPTAQDRTFHRYRKCASLEDKRYYTQAQTNETRVSMGYPRKGDATLSSPKFKEIEKPVKRLLATTKLRQMVDRLTEWRRENFSEWLSDFDKIEKLSITPLTLLEAYERWTNEVLEDFAPPQVGKASFVWDSPRVWENDPRMLGSSVRMVILPKDHPIWVALFVEEHDWIEWIPGHWRKSDGTWGH